MHGPFRVLERRGARALDAVGVGPSRDDVRDPPVVQALLAPRAALRREQPVVQPLDRPLGRVVQPAREDERRVAQHLLPVRAERVGGARHDAAAPVEVHHADHAQQRHQRHVWHVGPRQSAVVLLVEAVEGGDLDQVLPRKRVPRLLAVVEDERRAARLLVLGEQVRERLDERLGRRVATAQHAADDQLLGRVDDADHLGGVRLGAHRVHVDGRELTELLQELVQPVAQAQDVPYHRARRLVLGRLEQELVDRPRVLRRRADGGRHGRLQQRVVEVEHDLQRLVSRHRRVKHANSCIPDRACHSAAPTRVDPLLPPRRSRRGRRAGRRNRGGRDQRGAELAGKKVSKFPPPQNFLACGVLNTLWWQAYLARVPETTSGAKGRNTYYVSQLPTQLLE